MIKHLFSDMDGTILRDGPGHSSSWPAPDPGFGPLAYGNAGSHRPAGTA